MNKLVYSFGIVGASLLMASCGCSKKTANVSALNGEWNIVEVDGKAVAATDEKLPFIGFDTAEKRIYGNSGCNRMMGTFAADSLKPGMLSFGQIAGTRMACPDMTTEQNVLTALNKVKSFEVVSCSKEKDASCKVALCDQKGNKVVLIEKKAKEQAPVTLSMLDGEWFIKTVNGAPVGKAEKTPFLGFDIKEGRVFGTAGCNSLNGEIKQDEKNPKAIDLGQMATTMMMCPDMETESTILKALGEVKAFDVLAEGSIAFYNADGKEVMTLIKK